MRRYDRKPAHALRAGDDATDVTPVLANPHIRFSPYGLSIYSDERQGLEQNAQNRQEVAVNHVPVRAAAAATWSLPPPPPPPSSCSPLIVSRCFAD
ncbi:hypothetical protein EYF80_040234 [Liparis tanakae]|uniref:Uncharacterized protein n=1 Tax=Liparis tanakae TaxID=230148 RepID=A0A4Z2G7S4_9TELE|nr:hypothetical protein EYF80_040234 [Liparis tanakae]